MKPYYQAWKTSKHNKVACVECHYPPSKTQTILWKKFQALSQVVKYVTRTYSSKPFAEIEDASCLKQGCHSTKLLEGKIITKRGIEFNHKPHLTETRRGKHLRCASCHSQIVVGKHIEVTWDTCYLCHFKEKFKGRDLSPVGGCTSCHKTLPSKEFKIGNIVYNHKDFVTKHGVECRNCHLDVIQGNGEAPKERCFTCHNQPEKLEKYGDITFMHENHITKHQVACFHCHKEMKHKVTAYATLEYDCSICHIDKHHGQKDMYRGIGGRGVAEIPSPMYLANVDCIGCHLIKPDTALKEHFTGINYSASEVGCKKCHGEKYRRMLPESKKYLDKTLGGLESKLNEAKLALKEEQEQKTKIFLQDAEYNIGFVRYSYGIHNIYYSAQLLKYADEQLTQLGILLKKTFVNMDSDPLINGNFCATMCHQEFGVKVPQEFVRYKTKQMPHLKHYREAGLSCANCHILGKHKEVKLKDSKNLPCKDCHTP